MGRLSMVSRSFNFRHRAAFPSWGSYVDASLIQVDQTARPVSVSPITLLSFELNKLSWNLGTLLAGLGLLRRRLVSRT